MKQFAIIRLDKYVINDINGQKFIMIIHMSLVSECNHKIGNPRPFTPQVAAGAPKKETPSEQHLFPIRSLNPYHDKWTIKARVLSKSDVRTWNNDRGTGKLFSFELIDKEGDKIRCTAFNEQVDSLVSVIEVGKVYYISKGKVKFANKKYNSLGEYEISLDKNSTVTLANEPVDIQAANYHFTKINQIQDVNAGQTVDVIGYMMSIGEVEELHTKAGKMTKKRVIVLADDSNASIEVTVWGNKAEANVEGKICAISGAKVSDFNGKSLSTIGSSIMEFDPDIREAGEISYWQQNGGTEIELVGLSTKRAKGSGNSRSDKVLQQIQTESLGRNGKDDWISCMATLTKIEKDKGIYYPACVNENCHKKVQENNGKFFCESCNKMNDTADYRYIMKANILDHTGSQRVDFFNNTAEVIMGMKANDLNDLKANKVSYESAFEIAEFSQFYFSLKVALSTYQENQRLQVTAMKIFPIDYVKSSQRLLERIAKYEAKFAI